MIELLMLALLGISMALLTVSIILARKSYRLYRAVANSIMPKTEVKKLRKRYVIFAAICEERVTYEKVDNAIREAFMKLYGESHTHKASPRLLVFDEDRQRGIIRVLHLYTDHLIASLGLIKNIGGVNCVIVPIRVTGTIKKARRYLDVLKL